MNKCYLDFLIKNKNISTYLWHYFERIQSLCSVIAFALYPKLTQILAIWICIILQIILHFFHSVL